MFNNYFILFSVSFTFTRVDWCKESQFKAQVSSRTSCSSGKVLLGETMGIWAILWKKEIEYINFVLFTFLDVAKYSCLVIAVALTLFFETRGNFDFQFCPQRLLMTWGREGGREATCCTSHIHKHMMLQHHNNYLVSYYMHQQKLYTLSFNFDEQSTASSLIIVQQSSILLVQLWGSLY